MARGLLIRATPSKKWRREGRARDVHTATRVFDERETRLRCMTRSRGTFQPHQSYSCRFVIKVVRRLEISFVSGSGNPSKRHRAPWPPHGFDSVRHPIPRLVSLRLLMVHHICARCPLTRAGSISPLIQGVVDSSSLSGWNFGGGRALAELQQVPRVSVY